MQHFDAIAFDSPNGTSVIRRNPTSNVIDESNDGGLSFTPIGGGGFGADTLIQLPNVATTLKNAWESIITLTNNGVGTEASQWAISLLKAGAVVGPAYTFGPDTLALASLSAQINFGPDNFVARAANGNLVLKSNSDVVAETVTGGALATNATHGFFQIPTCPGTPTGTLAALNTGKAAIVYDSTNFKLGISLGGGVWKQTAALT